MNIMKFKERILTLLPYLICLAFSVIAGLPLLHPGLIPTHDGEYHVIRFYEFFKMFKSGTLYPRWAPDLYFGYGVPLFTYVYPLPNYIALLFHFFSISFIDSFKLNMFAATIVGCLGMYLWSKRYWGKLGGIVSAIFYTYSPYHFVDIYIRGSVGEVWGLGLFPFFMWSLDRIKIKRDFLSIAIAAIFCALIIFSHNILALIYIFVAFIYSAVLVFSSQEKHRLSLKMLPKEIYIYLSVFALGLGLSAIFWLPALLEKNYVTGLQVYDVTRNFTDFFQLVIPSWGSDFFGSMSATQMSVQIGLANLLAVLVSVVASIRLLIKRDFRFMILLFFLALFLAACFFVLSASRFFWENIPLLSYFQFPWRLLGIIIFCSSFLAGSIAIFPKRLVLACNFIIVAFLSTYQYSFPAHYFIRNDNYYINRSNFIDGTNSVGNFFNTKWANGISKRADAFVDYIYPEDIITFRRFGETKYILKAKLSKNRIITFNTLYFPGWILTANTKSISIWPDKLGRTQFSLNKGVYLLTYSLKETLIQGFAKWISIISFVILFIFFIYGYSISYSIFQKKFFSLF